MSGNESRKIFIIGNGFDLNLGYPTRFKDFIDFCINWKSFYKKENSDKFVKGDSESNIDSFKLSYKDGKQINHWDIINELKIYVDKNELNELNDLDYLINNNGFIKYLKENKDNIKYERWSDFENYLFELCAMCDEHERIISQYAEIQYGVGQPIFNSEFYKFLTYIYNEGSCYSRAVLPKGNIVKTLVKNDKTKYIKKMSDELQAFNKAFNIYLKNYVHKMEPPQWSFDFDNNTFVIDFNYTNFAKGIFREAKINYVHGYQHDNNIIIGINGDDLSKEYDSLTKKYLRLRLNVGNTQINSMELHGKYDSIDDFKNMYERSIGVRRIVPMYVIVIGQSLNRVDWDVLVDYFNNEEIYSKVLICYHNSYDSSLFNLYQMLESYNNDYIRIENRMKKGYYSFVKFDDLRVLLDEINKNIENLSIHKYDDLDVNEEKVLREIIKHQSEIVGGKKYLASTDDIDEEEMSDILESLNFKNYIRIENAPRTLKGPRRPYIITKILKY